MGTSSVEFGHVKGSNVDCMCVACTLFESQRSDLNFVVKNMRVNLYGFLSSLFGQSRIVPMTSGSRAQDSRIEQRLVNIKPLT